MTITKKQIEDKYFNLIQSPILSDDSRPELRDFVKGQAHALYLLISDDSNWN